MINMQPLGLQNNQILWKNTPSTSLNLWCYNGGIIQWDIFCNWNWFSVVWYSEKVFWKWICSCSDRPPFHEKKRQTDLQFPKSLVIFRIVSNWQSRSKVWVIPSVDYRPNKSLLDVKWLNYSIHNIRSFLSNLIYQSSLFLLLANYLLPPVNGSHLSTAARTLMIHPLLFAAWCLTTNSHPFWYNDFGRKLYTLKFLVYFINMVNVLLMVIIFS
jgi:hypothetical protein